MPSRKTKFRRINRTLRALLVRTNWTAYLEKGIKVNLTKGRDILSLSTEENRTAFLFHSVFLARYTVPGYVHPEKGPSLRLFKISWRLFDRSNRFELWWSLRDDVQRTLFVSWALPWLFDIDIELSMFRRGWIQRFLGIETELMYGALMDFSRLVFFWRRDPAKNKARFSGDWTWQEIWKGLPKTVVEADEPRELLFRMPATPGYRATEHVIRLSRRSTTTKWPRPWKADQVRSGYDVSLDEPPLIPARTGIGTNAIYGAYIRDAFTDSEAIDYYIQRVTSARERERQNG